jgi:hypothetical protein
MTNMFEEKKEVVEIYTSEELIAVLPNWVINLIKHHWGTIKGIQLFIKYADEYNMNAEILSMIEISDIEQLLYPNNEVKSKITHKEHQIIADQAKARTMQELFDLNNRGIVKEESTKNLLKNLK